MRERAHGRIQREPRPQQDQKTLVSESSEGENRQKRAEREDKGLHGLHQIRPRSKTVIKPSRRAARSSLSSRLP